MLNGGEYNKIELDGISKLNTLSLLSVSIDGILSRAKYKRTLSLTVFPECSDIKAKKIDNGIVKIRRANLMLTKSYAPAYWYATGSKCRLHKY